MKKSKGRKGNKKSRKAKTGEETFEELFPEDDPRWKGIHEILADGKKALLAMEEETKRTKERRGGDGKRKIFSAPHPYGGPIITAQTREGLKKNYIEALRGVDAALLSPEGRSI